MINEQSSTHLGPYLVVLGERAKEHLYDLSLINSYLEKMTAETGLTPFLSLELEEIVLQLSLK